MAEIINLDDYRPDCRNCLYHTEQGGGACTYPGGWWWDTTKQRCATFRWRNGRPGMKGDQHGTDRKGSEGGFSGGV